MCCPTLCQSDGWEVIVQCCFNLYFSNYKQGWAFFHMLKDHSLYFVCVWTVYSFHFPIFSTLFFVLCHSIFKTYVYIRGICPLFVIHIANIFFKYINFLKTSFNAHLLRFSSIAGLQKGMPTAPAWELAVPLLNSQST